MADGIDSTIIIPVIGFNDRFDGTNVMAVVMISYIC